MSVIKISAGEAYDRFDTEPFLHRAPSGKTYEMYMLDRKTCVIRRLGCEPAAWRESEISPVTKLSIEDTFPIDWGNQRAKPSAPIPGICICDFYEIVLKTGCQCGGI